MARNGTIKRVVFAICLGLPVVCLFADVQHLVTAPPLRTSRLLVPPVAPTFAWFARLSDGTRITLNEIGTVRDIGGGKQYTGWHPRDRYLPTAPPVGGFSPAAAGSEATFPHSQAYRFVFLIENDREASVRIAESLITDDSKTEGQASEHGDDLVASIGADRGYRNAWLTFPEKDLRGAILIGWPEKEDTFVLSDYPLQFGAGQQRGLPMLFARPSQLYVLLPKSIRPAEPEVYKVEAVGYDRIGWEHSLGQANCRITPQTDKIALPIYSISPDIRSVQMRLTPYHWLRFSDLPLMLPSQELI